MPAYAYALTALAIGSVWLSVVLASLFAPSLVSGSQHEHLPLAAFDDWVWGALATGTVALTAMETIRADVKSRPLWATLGIGVAVIWSAVLLVSILAPDFVTGSDPTRLPFGAIISPIAGLVVTNFICRLVKSEAQEAMAAGIRIMQTRAAESTATDAAARLRRLPGLRDAGAITEAEFEAKRRELLSQI
jgi:hypothetical protein